MRRFGELEAVVMDRLWSMGGTATVREIFDDLVTERTIAYTTVMSTMDNLFHKGFLSRERVGRAYRYQAVASRAQYRARLMQDALGQDGEREAVLTHFVAELSRQEQERLHKLLRRGRDRK